MTESGALILVRAFMDTLFAGEDLGALEQFLAPDFKFRGPMYSFESAQAYIDELSANPPVGFSYEVTASFESGDTAALFFEFRKQTAEWLPQFSTPMAQYFQIRDGRIASSLLIFDRKAFDEGKAASVAQMS